MELGIYLHFGNRVEQWRYTQTLACCICICCLLECWVAWCWRERLISPFNYKTIAIRNNFPCLMTMLKQMYFWKNKKKHLFSKFVQESWKIFFRGEHLVELLKWKSTEWFTFVTELVFGASLHLQLATLLLKDCAIDFFKCNLRILWPKTHLCVTELVWPDLELTSEILVRLVFLNSLMFFSTDEYSVIYLIV